MFARMGTDHDNEICQDPRYGCGALGRRTSGFLKLLALIAVNTVYEERKINNANSKTFYFSTI